MLSILQSKVNGYSELSELKRNLNECYMQLADKNYDRVVEIWKINKEISNQIREKAIKLQNEEIANSMFVTMAYCEMLKNYSVYWKMLQEGKYKDSWGILQDTIDRLIDVTRFHKNHSDFSINKFNNHMIELEKLYPYKIFASSEMVIKKKKCSICKKSLLDWDCIHIPGNLYWGQRAVAICEEIQFHGVALVEHPVDKRCVMELVDDSRTEKEKFMLLNYFVEQVDNPLQLFSVHEEERVFYNEGYKELSRNDKCSCGSNKKFKKCCGKYKYERGSQFKIMLEDEIQLEPLKTAFDQIPPAG